MLAINGLTIAYGPVQVVQGVTVTVDEGQIVALIGPNGAGKSSVLRAVSGLIRPKAGDITFLGVPIVGVPPHEIANAGVAHVMEGRHLFGGLSVEDNLVLAGSRDDKSSAGNLEAVYQRWPRLRERREQLAGTLSGGEQQMLAIGRALMMRPRLLILDEPSWGLAPRVVRDLMETFSKLRREGVTILLCEQMANLALKVCDYAYVMTGGRVALQGTSGDLLRDPALQATYLGGEVGEGSRAVRELSTGAKADRRGEPERTVLSSKGRRRDPITAVSAEIDRSEREKARAERALRQLSQTGGLGDLGGKPRPPSEANLRRTRYAASEGRREMRAREFEANKRRSNLEEEVTTIRKEIVKLGTARVSEEPGESQSQDRLPSVGRERSGLESIRREKQAMRREPLAGEMAADARQSRRALSKWAIKERARRECEAENRRDRNLEEADPEHRTDRARQRSSGEKRSDAHVRPVGDRAGSETLRRTRQARRVTDQTAARTTPQQKRETPDRKLKELVRRQKQSRGPGGSGDRESN